MAVLYTEVLSFYQYLQKLFNISCSSFKPGAKIMHLNKQIISKAIQYLQILTDLQIG